MTSNLCWRVERFKLRMQLQRNWSSFCSIRSMQVSDFSRRRSSQRNTSLTRSLFLELDYKETVLLTHVYFISPVELTTLLFAVYEKPATDPWNCVLRLRFNDRRFSICCLSNPGNHFQINTNCEGLVWRPHEGDCKGPTLYWGDFIWLSMLLLVTDTLPPVYQKACGEVRPNLYGRRVSLLYVS